MKLKANPFLRASFVTAAFALCATAASADTISSSVDLRILSNETVDTGALSLYNDGGNVQRSFLQFDLSSYSGKSITSDATLTLVAGIYGDSLTGVSIGTANSSWTAGTINWSTQPGLTAIPGATNPDGTITDGADVTWTIPWYMLEKMATTGSGYNNGLGITSGVGSTQHFQSTGSGGPAPTLTFSAATAAGSTWSGGNGNWTDTANWAGSTVAEGIGQAATINGGSAVNITMDANRSVGSLAFSGADHTISSGAGKLALNVVSGSPTISVEATRTATISATIVGIDGLTKAGLGTLTLSGNNSYSGGTTINGGTLSLAAAGALPSGGGVVIGAGGKLSNDVPAGNSFALNGLTLTGGELAATSTPDFSLGNFYLQEDVTVSGSTRSTISADLRVVSGQTRDFNVSSTGDASGVDLLISGKLGHQNNVAWGYATKSGAGTMKLSGVNELGGMTVNGGRLILEDTAIGWTFPSSGLTNNSQLEFSVTSGSRGYGAAIDGSGALFKTGTGTQTLSGGLNYTGTTTVAGGTLNLQDSIGGGGSDYNGSNININGASTLRVSGLRYNFNGETFTFDSVGGGTIDAIASGAGGMVFTGNNTFATSGGAQNIISGTRIANEGFNLNGQTATFTVATGTDATSDLKVTGTLWNGGNVVKDGAGRMEIPSAQEYSGTTTVNQGTLIVSGNISTSSMTTVQTGATVSGAGTVGSLTIDSGAFLNPGNSPGILNVDGDYNQAGTLTIEITGLTAGSQHDQVNVDLTTGDMDGSVTLSGSLVTAFSGGSYANGNLLFILLNDGSDAISGTFSGLAQDAIVTNYGGFDWKISYTADSTGNTFTGGNDVALMAIPEPRAALLGGLGMLALLRRRR